MLVAEADPGAAEEIQEGMTNYEAEAKIDQNIDEIEIAGPTKSDADETNDGNGLNDEVLDKLESGTFQARTYPRLNWESTVTTNDGRLKFGPAPSLQRVNSMSSVNQQIVRPFGRGGASRRPSSAGSQFSSETVELARAEAASWAQMTPLIAATLGPLSVMLGIPTLTQRWHGRVLDPPTLPNGLLNYEELPDPTVNIILSAISLFCEAMGNGLLILRFSNFHTKITTWASYAFWWAKILTGVVNYIQFGIAHPETGDIIYLQGFWVGVCSMGVTVIILVFLTFNLAFLHSQSREATRRLHHVQREFMMQTLIFFLFIGITALAFSRAEKITYVDGIYYIVVTTLTIGFGDITPQTTVMKVLTFPFLITGITLLALNVASIVRLLSDRARRRKLESKKRLKKKVSEKKRTYLGYGSKLRPWMPIDLEADEMRLKRSLTLQEELETLREKDWRRERRANLKSMAIGFTVFLCFWFIGALIFNFVEPWGYGNSLYFCYIFFLTVGFGDFFPTTEAGRPIFIVYALLAVPTMTIIVETVTTNFAAYTVQRVRHKKRQVYLEKDFHIESLTSLVKTAKQKTSERVNSDLSDDKSIHLPLHNFTERLMDSLQQMHHHLQSLLLQKLGPEARNVITAERLRLDRVEKERLEATLKEEHKQDASYIPNHLSEVGKGPKDELELLNEYRERYATILAELQVAKERLLEIEKALEGRTRGGFQRRLSEEIEELSGDDDDETRMRRILERRRRSIPSGKAAYNGGPVTTDVEGSRRWN